MSVINQMLRDLDKDQKNEIKQAGSNVVFESSQNRKYIVATIVVVLFVLGFFINNIFADKEENKNSEMLNFKTETLDKNTTQKVVAADKVSEVKQQQNTTLKTQEADTLTPLKPPEKNPLKITNEEKINRLEKPKLDKVIKQKSTKINFDKTVLNKQNKTTDNEVKFEITRKVVPVKTQAKHYWKEAEKNPLKAEQLLTKALSLDPNLDGARLQLVALLVSQKRTTEAETMTDQGLFSNPENAGYIEWKARLRIASNDPQAGLQWLLKSKPKVAEHITYYGILASLASQLKHNELAAKTYLKLTTIQPQHGPWLLGLAISEERLGKYDSARRFYNKAKSANGLTTRAQVFIQQKLTKLES